MICCQSGVCMERKKLYTRDIKKGYKNYLMSANVMHMQGGGTGDDDDTA